MPKYQNKTDFQDVVHARPFVVPANLVAGAFFREWAIEDVSGTPCITIKTKIGAVKLVDGDYIVNNEDGSRSGIAKADFEAAYDEISE